MEGNPICKMQGCSMDKVKYNIKQIKVKQLKGYKLLSYIGGQEMRNKKIKTSHFKCSCSSCYFSNYNSINIQFLFCKS